MSYFLLKWGAAEIIMQELEMHIGCWAGGSCLGTAAGEVGSEWSFFNICTVLSRITIGIDWFLNCLRGSGKPSYCGRAGLWAPSASCEGTGGVRSLTFLPRPISAWPPLPPVLAHGQCTGLLGLRSPVRERCHQHLTKTFHPGKIGIGP